MIIPIYGLTWHLNQSPALRELVTLPLSPYMQFEQRGWDGAGDLPGFQTEWLKSSPIIFFQLLPLDQIFKHPNAHIIWIPMWDSAREYDLEWWSRLPKNLRVVSFSNEISQRAQSVGLNTLDLRYFISPVDCEQVNWGAQRILLYWNRTGMVGEAFLRKFCEALDIEVLLFRRRLDPAWSSWYDYELPNKLGSTLVKELTIDGADAQRRYFQYLNQANIFIAPRLFEGVGLSFIEALARGCAVFANDAPTMNEYITHKTNGYLLQEYHEFAFKMVQEQTNKQLRQFAVRMGYQNLWFSHPVTDGQNWTEIKKLDLQALGNKARQGQLEGYAAWKNMLPEYASFILDWK